MEKDSKKRLTHEEIKERILEGMRRARKKLIEKAEKEGFPLVIYENGKILRVKASEMNQ